MPKRRMNAIEYDLRKQTAGEKFWISRKSRGKTQAQAAAEIHVSRPVYWAIETDRREPPNGVPLKKADDWRLLLPLARRRSGLTLDRVAYLVGVSRPTIHAWEGQGSEVLVNFWRKRGFYA